MKTLLCILLIALAVNNVAATRRELQQTTANAVAIASDGGDASSTAIATDGGTAEATSKAKGCGADATTVAVADDGADVSGTTDVESEDCADVDATTIVTGDGEDADADVTTVLKSAEDIDVTIYVQRVQDGEEVETVAVAIVKEFDAYEYPRVVATLIKLASDEATYALFNACVLELYTVKGCEEFKVIVTGYLDQFIVFEIPIDVAVCIYPACSLYASADSCCGAAQLEQGQCACSGGSCAWSHPVGTEFYLPYWICTECVEEVELCACH